MRVLVIDVGGTHVKMLVTDEHEPRRFDSGRDLTPESLIERVRSATSDWIYNHVSLGYPGEVGVEGPEEEPGNLGRGWLDFDFESAFACPVRVVNDAAMQALGGYDGGRMLFLGLGTGLGSALVADRVVISLELGCLRSNGGETLADRLGRKGRERHGHAAWERVLAETVEMLHKAFGADYVLLGGGNSRLVEHLPEHARRGGNDDAFAGGFRLWEEAVQPHDRAPSSAWRVVP
ncbi:MAG TPA: hypothetical protein VHZ24_02450 [Pirellulales bacterium]|jgi:hypothetical protein|nr:hypothetical protein [Pirellulales bacterium]